MSPALDVVPPEERGPEYQGPYDKSDREVLANSYYALAAGGRADYLKRQVWMDFFLDRTNQN
jgi:hypothetical protein